MGEENGINQTQEICTIRIGFPVQSDEQAIDYKKKISEVLVGVPRLRMEFSINSVPVRGNPVM